VARLEGLWHLITDDGSIWEMKWPTGGITRLVGSGLPPASMVDQKTPTQHGSSYLGFRLENREVIIGIALESAGICASDIRRARPYKIFGRLSGPLTLRRSLPNGEVMELRRCRYGGGLEGDSDNLFDNAEYFAARIMCFDPVFYDTSSHSLTLLYADFSHGPSSSSATVDSTDGLSTDGDWYAYPTITVGGPCASFDLQSVTTGQRLRLTKNIAGAETVTIETNPHISTVISDVDGNAEQYIPPGDDFGGFRLDPSPLSADGANEWNLTVSGIDANSEFVFTWEDRYQGI